MQEIKLNNCETEKRWEWERIQVKLFKISIKGLALQQYQQLGSVFFNQTTNILISFLAARAVVSGEMTLGMMMSLTYIVGQLTARSSSSSVSRVRSRMRRSAWNGSERFIRRRMRNRRLL